MSLVQQLQRRIQQEGAISFADFMQHVLYDPEEGYYTGDLPKIGPQGDFVTAPVLTPLFGYTLANQCHEILMTLSERQIFEFGAGTGQLCVDILTRLEQLDGLPDQYQILEVSGSLRARQQALIKEKIPHLFHRVCWLSTWPTKPWRGVILANEVLDAMPVHRFLHTADQLLESYITYDAQNGFSEIFKPSTNERLKAHVQAVLPPHQYPYQSEVNLWLDDWIQQCAIMLQQGAMFIIDYGFPRHEYYHPDRAQGTLMCHYQQQAHTNPLIQPGQQDITAHVDFTHVAEAASRAGFDVTGFTNQASFLLANGLLSLLSASLADPHLMEQHKIAAQQAVKQLLQPSEMGELFKVIALTKQLDLPLSGFQLSNKRASL